ncbi:uncharacterized protein LOC130755554 isoform X2 [Actinidia eriantha]|uniref:uncharacterized protein LOC130755554 isoform X2 n=1 Tax=Actinidia eriantha TaxID=165200 RepID=UPI002584995F|nr:uncharacterized protein LOC130755554 isoform X2 [Actinidia eriantha]
MVCTYLARHIINNVVNNLSMLVCMSTDSEWLYFKAIRKQTLLGWYPSNVKGWKKKFFFISGDNWEFAHGQFWELGVPKVPRSWSTLGKRCNVPPVLTEVEQERFDRISGTLEQGQLYPIKDILRSKSFLRSFGLDSGRMASSGGDNVEQKPAGDAAHVAADEAMSKKVDMKRLS